MATVINGILSRKLPWGLVLLGVFLVIAVELLGIRSLSFAVGAYLSIGTTLAIFAAAWSAGSSMQAVKKAGGDAAEADSEISPGSLFASGLIAAGGIVGLIGVALKGYEATFDKGDLLNFPHTFLDNNYVSVVSLRRAGLLALLLRPQAAEEVDAILRESLPEHEAGRIHPVHRQQRPHIYGLVRFPRIQTRTQSSRSGYTCHRNDIRRTKEGLGRLP
jgi:hypothetical protein